MFVRVDFPTLGNPTVIQYNKWLVWPRRRYRQLEGNRRTKSHGQRILDTAKTGSSHGAEILGLLLLLWWHVDSFVCKLKVSTPEVSLQSSPVASILETERMSTSIVHPASGEKDVWLFHRTKWKASALLPFKMIRDWMNGMNRVRLSVLLSPSGYLVCRLHVFKWTSFDR